MLLFFEILIVLSTQITPQEKKYTNVSNNYPEIYRNTSKARFYLLVETNLKPVSDSVNYIQC